MKCPECGHTWTDESQPPKERRKVKAKFKDVAMVLSKHPSCEEAWKKFLVDVNRFDSVTEGQWKFFCVIHNKCLGTWPDWGDYAWAEEAPAPITQADPDDPDIPF